MGVMGGDLGVVEARGWGLVWVIGWESGLVGS